MSTVPCPNCGKIIAWTNKNPYRPFCCHRCQLIDLGKWADESHRIKGEPSDLNLDQDTMNLPNE